jgi:hypothetical protein
MRKLNAYWSDGQTVEAGFPPPQPEFNPRASDVGFMADKVTLRQVSSMYFGYHP